MALLPNVQVHWGSTAQVSRCGSYAWANGAETKIVLDCGGQSWSYVPTSIMLMHLNATHIYLNSNQIASISQDDFRDLVNVVYLRLSYNDITELPADVFSEMPALKILKLDRNEISVAHPDAFRGVPSLLLLYLENNPIDSLPSTLFSHIPNLEHLRVEINAQVHPDLLEGLDKLTYASFVGDPPPTFFSHTPNLAILTLWQCSFVHSIQFRGLTNLRELTIVGENITSLSCDVFRDNWNLVYLQIGTSIVPVSP